jgi:hypothetical protein
MSNIFLDRFYDKNKKIPRHPLRLQPAESPDPNPFRVPLPASPGLPRQHLGLDWKAARRHAKMMGMME